MNDLIYGINIEEIERITGEDQKIIKKWKKGTKKIPESAIREGVKNGSVAINC